MSRLLPVNDCKEGVGELGACEPVVAVVRVLLVPATLAQGIVTTLVEMILLCLLQGTAAATAFAPRFALSSDIAKMGNFGTTFSVLTMAFTLGTAVGPLIAEYLINFGYVVPFTFGAVLAGDGALLVYSPTRDTTQ